MMNAELAYNVEQSTIASVNEKPAAQGQTDDDSLRFDEDGRAPNNSDALYADFDESRNP